MSGRRVLLTLIVAVSLLLAGMTVLEPAPAVAALTAAPAAPLVTERPDRVSAQQAARAQGRQVEVTDLRTEESLTWANPDGTFTTELSHGPERVRLADGSWVPIDTTLEHSAEGVRPKHARAQVLFADGGGTDAATLVHPKGRRLGVALAGLARGGLPRPVLAGSVATYPDVLPGVAADLELEALPDGYAQRLVLRQRPTRALVLRLPLRLSGMSASIGAGGQLEFRDSAKAMVAVADAPWMWGAAWDTAFDMPVRRALVDTRIVAGPGGSQVLELRPDPAFLADPAVTLPITIDPSPSLEAMADTYVDSQSPTTSFASSGSLWLGRHDTTATAHKARTLIKFDLDALSGTHVLSATLKLWNNHTYDCQAPGTVQIRALTGLISESTTWNTQPGTGATVYAEQAFAHGNEADGCANAYEDIGLTSLTQGWVSGSVANHGLQIRAKFEDLLSVFKKFASNQQPVGPGQNHNKLVVTYNSYPATPGSSMTPGTGGFVPSLTPQLLARFRDADLGSGRVDFEVANNATSALVASGTGSTVVSEDLSAWTVPAGSLAAGVVYKWRARGNDGTDVSAWSAYNTFTPDLTAPSAPTITSSSHPDQNAWTGGTAFSASWTAPADSPAGIQGYAVALDQEPATTPGGAVTQTTTSYSATLEPGVRYLHVRAVDRAGNWGGTGHYRVNVGPVAVLTPREGARTAKRLTLTADGPALSGGSTAADVSGNSHIGTLAGPTWVPGGKHGGALEFDGVDDLVTVADTAALDLSGAMTVSAWVKPSALTGWRTVVLKEHPSGLAYALYADSTDNAAGYLRTGGTEQGIHASDHPTVDTWQNLAVTYDGTILRLYADGVQVASQALTGSIETSTSPLRIGGNTIWGEYFAGLLDDVRVYNRALTQTEIQADLGQPVAAASGLVAGYRFDEGITGGGITYQFRRSPDAAWTTIPTANVTLADGGAVTWPLARGTDGTFPAVVWDLPATTGIDATDGPVQLRALTTTGAESQTVNVTLDQQAELATDEIGPGVVNLLTGNYILSTPDVSIDAWGTDLAVSRTFNSRTPGANPDGVVGPGWSASLPVEDADSDWQRLDDKGDFVLAIDGAGGEMGFMKDGTEYVPEPEAEDLTLTKPTSSRFELADLDGNVTTFEKPTGATNWVPTKITQSGTGTNTTTVTYTVLGGGATRASRITAPAPAGVTCTTLVAGCRALDFTYATATTATGTAPAQWGDYTGRLKTVTFTAYDPATSAMSTVAVASYQYDNTGRLRAVWDPRISPALKTTYDYDADGHLTTLTPPGELPWTLSYVAIGGDPNTGRLRAVSRPGIPSGTATTTVVYNVPLSGAGAPYPMDVSDVDAWGQADLPTDATAVFPPDLVPPALPAMPSSYERATISYFNADGRQVNEADPGGFITTTEYDQHGNTIRELSAGNRNRALTSGTTVAEHKARALELDERSIYSADGLEELESLGPLHTVRLTTGELVEARAHTVTTYDQGAPPTGGPFHLPTTTQVGARIDGQATDADVQVTVTGYDNGGWELRQATETTEDAAAGGLNLKRVTRYDAATGLVSEVRQPAGAAGGTAHTTLTRYYTAGTHPIDSTCGNKPQWANLVCKTLPAAQPDTPGLPDLPTITYQYNRYNQPTVETEAVGSVTRTSTTTHDPAGRIAQVQTSSTVGEPLPAVTTTYDPATGRATTTSTTDGLTTTTVTHNYDARGRLTGYDDADGNHTTTTTYDLLDRPVTIDDGKGTRTITYDGGSERRGLATSVTDSHAGTFTGTYDADGALVTQTYPNGLQATTTLDEAGVAVQLDYIKTTGCTTNCTWLSFAVEESVHGQWLTHTSNLSTQAYTYDGLDRLTAVQDTTPGQGCVTRTYTLDADTNRGAQASYPAAADGSCTTATTPTTGTHTYDAADRLTDTGTSYDTFGRTTALSAANAGGSALTASYHVNDLVRTLTKDGKTRTFTLDPTQQRLRTWQETGGSDTQRRTYHYADDGDAPAWTAETTDGAEWTRTIEGLDGNLAALYDSGDAITSLQLADLHGDIVATATTNPADLAPTSTFESIEFGQPRSGPGISPRYGWLGGKQRQTDTLTGLTLMGVRLYTATLGRFLQVDPEPGGSANAYDYVEHDPVNGFDLDGRWGWKSIRNAARTVGRATWQAAKAVGRFAWKYKYDIALTALSFVPALGAAAWAIRGYRAYRAYRVYRAVRTARKIARLARWCRNSFAPETLVVMGDGSRKPISEIRIGEVVQTADPVTGRTTPQPVVDLIVGVGSRHIVDIDLDGDPSTRPLTATANHPFWVIGHAWMSAADLRPGDALLGLDGKPRTVAMAADRGEVADQIVYNLSVANVHTFAVQLDGSQVIVHNCTSAASYSGHALEQMARRGISKDMVNQALRTGTRSAGRSRGTTKVRGRRIWVVVNRSCRVVSCGWNRAR